VSCGLIVPLPRDPSCAVGVGQPAILPICVRLTPVIPSVIPDPLRSPSEAAGVGQPVIFSCIRRDGFPNIAFAISGSGACDPVSVVVGVGQPVIAAVNATAGYGDVANLACRYSSDPRSRLTSATCGVGQPLSDEPEPLSDMRRADARSAQICRPDGVARGFHVSTYKVEPTEAVLARNLLSKDDCRLALADEVVPMRPEVPLVSNPRSSACRAERLARTGSRPNRAVVGPSGEAQAEAPAADPCEEVALSVSTQSIWVHVSDVGLIHISIRDQTALDEFTQPRSRLRV